MVFVDPSGADAVLAILELSTPTNLGFALISGSCTPVMWCCSRPGGRGFSQNGQKTGSSPMNGTFGFISIEADMEGIEVRFGSSSYRKFSDISVNRRPILANPGLTSGILKSISFGPVEPAVWDLDMLGRDVLP